MELRLLSAEDAPIIMEMAKNNPPLEEHTPYTYWVMCSYCNRCSYALFVDNQIIGYVMCVENPNTVFIWQLCVLPEFRKNGYATILLNEVFDLAKTLHKNIQMTIEDDNAASVGCFQKICTKYQCTMKVIGEVQNHSNHTEYIYRIDF